MVTFLVQVQYILCYACAGSQFQMCATQQGIPIAHTLGRPLSLARLEDRLQVIWIAVRAYWVIKAQAKQLPAVFLPLGHTEISEFSEVQYFDVFVQKRVLISQQWPLERTQLMKDVYAASCATPFLIHAVDPPCVSHSGKQYVVDLEPVGQPVLSKYGDRKPKLQFELKTSIR